MSDAGIAHWPHVPGYDVVGILGRGGFATVLEAVQLSVDRRVALKLMARPVVEPAIERRFRRECRTVGSLSWHPNVVALYDAGITEAGLPFLAMELVRGGTWGERVNRAGACTAHQVVRVGLEVADALGAAHDAGILHRDVKPDNVLIGRRGESLLGDFGVATLSLGTDSTMDDFRGTFAYSAPELLSGERATAASEVYGLGATLFTLATGRSPFARDPEHDSPAALVLRIVSGDPPPVPASVPEPLARVIERAMAKEAAARYPSVGALGDALREIEPVVVASNQTADAASLLDVLGHEERADLLRIAGRRRFIRNEVVFKEGDPGDTLYLILQGHVAVRVTTPQGEATLLRVLGTAEVFGELSLIDPAPRVATVVALSDCECLAIPSRHLQALRQAHPAVDRLFLRAVIGEVRRLSAHQLELMHVPVEKRLLRRLVELASVYGVAAPVTIPLTQDELAQLTGTTRRTVSRLLRGAEKAGLLRVGRGRIEVLNIDELDRLGR